MMSAWSYTKKRDTSYRTADWLQNCAKDSCSWWFSRPMSLCRKCTSQQLPQRLYLTIIDEVDISCKSELSKSCIRACLSIACVDRHVTLQKVMALWFFTGGEMPFAVRRSANGRTIPILETSVRIGDARQSFREWSPSRNCLVDSFDVHLVVSGFVDELKIETSWSNASLLRIYGSFPNLCPIGRACQ